MNKDRSLFDIEDSCYGSSVTFLGHFDVEGNYIPNKDSDDITDGWLDSVDWNRVQNYKKGGANIDEEMEEKDEKFDSLKSFKEMLEILQPGELTVTFRTILASEGLLHDHY